MDFENLSNKKIGIIKNKKLTKLQKNQKQRKMSLNSEL